MDSSPGQCSFARKFFNISLTFSDSPNSLYIPNFPVPSISGKPQLTKRCPVIMCNLLQNVHYIANFPNWWHKIFFKNITLPLKLSHIKPVFYQCPHASCPAPSLHSRFASLADRDMHQAILGQRWWCHWHGRRTTELPFRNLAASRNVALWLWLPACPSPSWAMLFTVATVAVLGGTIVDGHSTKENFAFRESHGLDL